MGNVQDFFDRLFSLELPAFLSIFIVLIFILTIGKLLGRVMGIIQNFFKQIFVSELPTLKITMLGPTAVGKTSLLAAMYDRFENSSKNLQLKPQDQTYNNLRRRLDELKKDLVGDSIKVRGGVASDNQPRSYIFDFGETGASPALSLHFQDYPGEYINNDKPEQINKVKNFIRESVAIIIPIDAAALIEENGKHHEVEKINNLCKDFCIDLKSPKLVILAPVKCEKYLDNPRYLINKVRDGYSTLLNKLSGDKLVDKVAVVITPVATVGAVVFSRVEYEDNEPTFIFRKLNPTDQYEPKYSEQPIRYLLKFLINLHIKNKYVLGISRILNLFSQDQSLQKAVYEFASTTNIQEISEVVQGAHLLEL